MTTVYGVRVQRCDHVEREVYELLGQVPGQLGEPAFNAAYLQMIERRFGSPNGFAGRYRFVVFRW